MTQPPTGTVTFLFTDIEGSTKLWQNHPEQMQASLVRHDALLRHAVEQHSGYVVKPTGDGVFAAFTTAPDALAAALSAQRALMAEPWNQEAPISVRMALHTGVAEERGNDYYGLPINRVARLLAAGHGGQILLSLAAQELTRDALPPSASLRDLHECRLKDLGRPERVFQLLHPELRADFPPLRSLDNPDLRNNLPQQATSFIGREKGVAEVKTLLDRTRLLTLTGAGGCGKTRLALQVAADLLTGDGDGVWLVELAALSDPALVPQAAAEALGVKEVAGQPIQRTLVDWLRPKRLLLVLDNCEHLVAVCASLAADLLRSCPNVHVLATSRERLNVTGEQTYRVPSLSLPDPKQMQTVEGLSQYEAVRLFIERAQAVKLGFAVTNAIAPAMAQICFRLDGIPLAIELAAARVRSLSVEEINARLDQRFRLLTGGARDRLPRQQTLRALIDWSYDLLDEQETLLFARLSVFAGGWTSAAAESVCSDEGIEEWEILDLLTTLVDKSLVIAQPERGATRYALLETLRQYSSERLVERGGSAFFKQRHRDYFLALAEEARPKLWGSEEAYWLAVLEGEHDNLRQALSFCTTDATGGEKGLRLGAALQKFWWTRGHLSEGRERLTAILALPGAQVRAESRADALNGAGALARMQGDYASARALYEESLAIRRELGNKRGIAICLSNLGAVAKDQGDYASARSLFGESLAIHRELGEKRGLAICLGNLGVVAGDQGDYASARSLQEESLLIERELGNKSGIAYCLSNLGVVACQQGDCASAGSLYEESLALRRELGDKGGVAYCLVYLGNVAHDQGDYASARSLYEESLEIFRRMGDKNGIAYCLRNLGNVANGQGDYASARSLHAESLAIYRELGDKSGIAYCLEAFASLAVNEGRQRRSIRLWGAASALREVIGSPLPPNERERYDREIASTREALGEAAFTAASEQGRAMTWEQAVEYGLEEQH